MRREGALAGSLKEELRARRERALEILAPPPTFREFLESPHFAGPFMSAIRVSPAILAIVEAADGAQVTAIDDATAVQLFRTGIKTLPVGPKPRVVVVNAGRRGGKTSNLLAPACVHAAWTVPIPDLREGEIARAVIISSEVDLAEAAFNYCVGIVQSSPRLRRGVVKINSEEILLRRPDGKLVEIVVGAANGGGTAARSRTLVFVGMDEAAFFYAADGHTVNDQVIYDAALGSLQFTSGAQLWIVSTPWVEGLGLMEELIEAHWGKATPGGVLVAARISSYQLRGIPDDGSLKELLDEDTYRREILCIPLPPGAKAFFSAVQLAEALKRAPPAGSPEQRGAGGDFAFEHDCAAVAVVGRWLGGVFAPTLVEERNSTPGNIEAATATVRELGEALAATGMRAVMSDHHRRTFVREHLAVNHVAFVDAPGSYEGKVKTYGALKRVIEEGRFALGHLPRHLAEYIRDQLRSVVTKPLPAGAFKIVVPRKKKAIAGAGAGGVPSGVHGDVTSAIVLAAWQAGSGETAAAWQKPKVPAHVREVARPARAGAGSSLDFLRSRSGQRGRSGDGD